MRNTTKIDITDIRGFHLGTAEDVDSATGVTVLIADKGATAGVDVRGGGPATRETDLLKPENMVQQINAVCLSGGSAFGLESGCGVMDALEERGMGFDTGFGVVPIVCGASLFDIHIGTKGVRPDKAMGTAAVENAFQGVFQTGNHGAGTGATIGKFKGPATSMKSGLGASALSIEEFQVGAVTALNALGDVIDENGVQVGGIVAADGSLESTPEAMAADAEGKYGAFKGNTTISCIITNGTFTKAECTKLASIAHDGYARAIKPVHTSADGDTIFVMATGEVEMNFDTAAMLATQCIEDAIRDGLWKAESAYGLPCAKDLKK